MSRVLEESALGSILFDVFINDTTLALVLTLLTLQ